MMQKQLSKQNFQELLEALALIKDVCNDADIRGGQLRQIVNNKTFIVDMNLVQLLEQNDLVLPLVKTKLSLLGVFLDGSTEEDINFMEFEGKYIFQDATTLLRFTVNTNSDYLDNKFISENEFPNLVKIDESKLIFSCELDKFLLNKIRIITENLNVDDIIINIVNNQASLDIVSFNKLNDAKILKDVPVQQLDSEAYKITLSAVPFKLDFKQDCSFSMYDASTNNDGKIICSITTMFNDCELKLYLPGYLTKV